MSTNGKPTLTVGELRALLAEHPDDTPIIVGTDAWYLNITDATFNPDNPDIAVTIETADNYDTRQW